MTEKEHTAASEIPLTGDEKIVDDARKGAELESPAAEAAAELATGKVIKLEGASLEKVKELREIYTKARLAALKREEILLTSKDQAEKEDHVIGALRLNREHTIAELQTWFVIEDQYKGINRFNFALNRDTAEITIGEHVSETIKKIPA